MSFPLPGTDLPVLKLNIPPSEGKASNVELNETLLKHWVEKLSAEDLPAFLGAYQQPLYHFNHRSMPPLVRLKMLEIYRQPLNRMVMQLTSRELSQSARSIEQQNQLIDSLMQRLNELAIGYKITIMNAAAENNTLTHNAVAKMAIHRAIEQLSYLIIHAYKFYRQPPAGIYHDLHQLFLACLQAGIGDETPNMSLQQLKAEGSYQHRYIQMMLLGICDPYSLRSNTVLKVYRMMGQLAPLAETQLHQNFNAVQGMFYINAKSDRLPEPGIYARPTESESVLVALNTKNILNGIERLLKQASSEAELDITLINQITPYLNSAYQRKQPRQPVTGAVAACVIQGFTSIHRQFAPQDQCPLDTQQSWQILNKNDRGFLLSSPLNDKQHRLTVGELVAMTEVLQDQRAGVTRLATIQWLRHDRQGQTKLGLALLPGTAKPIHFRVPSQDQLQPALLIPESVHPPFPASIICHSGVYRPEQILQLQSSKKFLNFTIHCKQLIDNYGDSERITIHYCE
ncbi:hypothetical protein [Methylophaga lonarensis]|uniref:hypothetical protein n=1 Tax=Methylophaga lonarensis TaxID=999151 RepID=UPI003D2819D7